MKPTTAFGLGIAFGYLMYRDREDIRAYKKQIKELEEKSEELKKERDMYYQKFLLLDGMKDDSKKLWENFCYVNGISQE